MLLLALLTVAILCCYLYMKSKYSYWKTRGVPFPQPSIFFGNVGAAIFAQKSLGDVYTSIYNTYESLRYVGFYKIRQPGIVLRDTELIREVLAKHFSSFHENDFKVDRKLDPLLGMDPFFQNGERWKENRNRLTPALTSRQIKSMYPLMQKAAQAMVSYVESSVIRKEGIEAKELSAKYTTDIVASCAFGLEANSFEDPKAEFRKMSKKIIYPSFFLGVKLMLQFVFPVVAKIAKIKLISSEVALYFRNIIDRIVAYKKANNISRNDFLDMMIELQNKLGANNFTEEEITGLALIFFLDGFETSSISLSYTLYELASNLNIQNKLREEIEAAFDPSGNLDYDTVSSLPYLDKVINENLRKNSPVLYMGKICTEPFTLPSPDDKGPDVTIEENTVVIIPVAGLHSDPKYFPNPDQFDPDRFAEGKKESIPKFAFLPFGEGPRMCPGIKFGITQIKVAITKIIRNFEVRVNKRTMVPLQVDPTYFLLAPKGGIWLNFYKIQK